MTDADTERRRIIVSGKIAQLRGYEAYLPAVLAQPIAQDTGWSLGWIIGGPSLALLVSGLVSPWIGRTIDRHGGRPVLATSAVLLAGLALLGLASGLALYIAAWLVIGLGMGADLYDPASRPGVRPLWCRHRPRIDRPGHAPARDLRR